MKCRRSSGLSSGSSWFRFFRARVFSSGPERLVVLLGATVMAAACSHQPPPAAETPLALARRPASITAPAAPRARSSGARSAEAQPPSRDNPAIFFDFDSAALRDDARPALQGVADRMRVRGDARVRVEGNCDRLGTVEYNLALGEHRARAAKDYLISLGIPDERIATVSYGSERPKYPGPSEDERAKNRRDDLVIR